MARRIAREPRRDDRARGRRRALQPRPLGPSGRRRRRVARDSGRRAHRAGRHQLLRGHGHEPARLRDAGTPRAHGRAVLRDGRLARAAPEKPARADDAPEPSLLHRRAAGRPAHLVVRWRLRPHALLSRARRRAALAPHGARSLCGIAAATRSTRPGATATSSCRTGTRRAASAASSSTTSARPRSRPASRSRERSAKPFRGPGCRSRASARDAVRRARARVPAAAPRALRRVQPRLRPRHALRPADRRARGIHPDVAAAAGALGVRLDAGAGLGGSLALSEYLRPRDWLGEA